MKDNKHMFWVSYSDLMTSLFFIMLVLFVITVGYLRKKQGQLTDINTVLSKTVEEQKQLLQLDSLFTPLTQDSSFRYLPECNKYVFNDFVGKGIFDSEKTTIKNEFIESTIKAGQKIESFLKKLKQNNPELSYILLIEGNMANHWDKTISKDDNEGYITSYERALAVYQLWRKNSIDLRRYNTEIMICGSGFNGECREFKEENNKRFSIQIIPKVSYNKTKQ